MNLLGRIVSWSFPAPRPADPSMGLTHFTNGTGLNQFDHPAEICPGMNLSAHLRLHSGLGRGLRDDPALVNVTGEGLFAIDVLFRQQGGQGGKGVGMLGGGHHHRIDIVDLLVKVTEIRIGPRILAPRKANRSIQCLLVYAA